MKPEFILMLTYNDTTVKDALSIFRECKDAPIMHWGFTIDTALFDKKFVSDGSFFENTLPVCSWLEKTDPSTIDKYLDYQEKVK